MGKALKGIGKAISPVLNVASMIPGVSPWVGAASGVLGMMDANEAARAQEGAGRNALGNQTRYTEEQIRAIREYMDRQRQLDPGRETEIATQAYDSAAQESLNRDMSTGRMPISMRGLKGSSEYGGATSDVLGRRAHDRGQFVAGLKLDEGQRRSTRDMNVLNAAHGLAGPASVYGGQANFHYGQAGQYDPSGFIKTAAEGLKGIKWPWQKKQAKAGGSQIIKMGRWGGWAMPPSPRRVGSTVPG